MDFVMQFGIIVMFSSVFPLAAFLFLLLNAWTEKIIFTEIFSNKRGLPEMSQGIGPFLYMLELLSHASVFINASIIYFTSETFKEFYIVDTNEKTTICLGSETMCTEVPFNKLFLTTASFLVAIVLIEHGFIFLKFIFTKLVVENTSRIESERLKETILEQYLRK
jgi:hypothetical protein